MKNHDVVSRLQSLSVGSPATESLLHQAKGFLEIIDYFGRVKVGLQSMITFNLAQF